MRSVASILLIAVVFGCKEDSTFVPAEIFSPEPISDDLQLTEGTGFVRIFDQASNKVFESTVDVQGASKSGHIVITKGNGEDFGWIYLATSKTQEKNWDASNTWYVSRNVNDAKISIIERVFTLMGDWGYDGTNGTITINDQNDQFVKGRFLVDMSVTGAPENSQGFEWVKNPAWGDHIIIEGRFYATPTLPQ
jgi:hypothetical protein